MENVISQRLLLIAEGVGMAEKSIAKMGVKPVVTSDIVKQQKELEEQRRKIQEQKDEVTGKVL